MGKPIAVVAGAGPGIGLASARRFAREGFDLALIARDPSAGQHLEAALVQEGTQALVLDAHTAEPSALQEAFRHIQQRLGPPDVLIYNASLGHPIPLSQLKPAELLLEFQVNVAAALQCAQLVLPEMRKKGQGSLLFTGGGSALKPDPKFPGLSIGKAGMRSLALSLAVELEPEGIHAATVTVCGFVQPETRFSPETVAEAFWQLHTQPSGAWQTETSLQ